MTLGSGRTAHSRSRTNRLGAQYGSAPASRCLTSGIAPVERAADSVDQLIDRHLTVAITVEGGTVVVRKRPERYRHPTDQLCGCDLMVRVAVPGAFGRRTGRHRR